MHSPYLDALKSRVLVFDGAMGTLMQARVTGPEDFGGPRWEGCIDYLSVTRPEFVEAAHTAYFEAGADVIETNTFQASRLRFEDSNGQAEDRPH